MSSEQRAQAIIGAVCAILLAGGTIFLCVGASSWWGVLTGVLALGALGMTIEALHKGSRGKSGAEGLAALFNNMDTQGAENFAKMLNQLGTASTPTAEAPPAGPVASKGSAAATVVLAPGKVRVLIVATLSAGSMAVKMQATLGAGPPNVLHLAVMCFAEGGKNVLHGQDKDEKWWKLTDVTQPAVLYVPRETLPHLKQQPGLWQRVEDCSEA